MNYILENEFLKIALCDHGAEVHSITGKKEGIEFLWNGDRQYWGYHAPVLFPIVGQVLDNKYMVEGVTYTLPRHGLARISRFERTARSDSSITFILNYTEESLKVYPFKFSFDIKYTLDMDSIITEYRITNMDVKCILFSVGAHPAFRCSLYSGENFSDYYFEFNEKETASIMEYSPQGFFTGKEIPFMNDENKIYLSQQIFKNDALVFHNLKSHVICLKSRNHDKFVEFDFTNFPYLGLWSKPAGAPFVCVEPWFGHDDFEGFTGEFKDKPGIISLDKNNEFVCSYKIKIHQ